MEFETTFKNQCFLKLRVIFENAYILMLCKITFLFYEFVFTSMLFKICTTHFKVK